MDRKYGCLEPKKDYRDYQISKLVSNIELPAEFKIEPKTIKDQGSVNSCVAHSLSSFLESKDNAVYSTRLDLWL